MTRDNYFQYGNLDELVISNSSMSYINPDEGGSILRFRDYISGQVEYDESKSLERGKLFHRYIEAPKNFVLALENVPSDAVCAVIHKVYQNLSTREELVFSGSLSLMSFPTEILKAADELGYGKASNWKSATILSKIQAADYYFNDLVINSGKIMVDAKTKEILMNLMARFEQNGYLKECFIDDWADSGITGPLDIWKEFPILFELDGLKCKAMLDRIEIDHKHGWAALKDIKTTSTPVSKFMGFKTRVPDKFYSPTLQYNSGPFHWYRIYRQMAFYKKALIASGLIAEDYKLSIDIVVCETIKPYEVIQYPVNNEWLYAGNTEIAEIFEVIKRSMNEIQNEQHEY